VKRERKRDLDMLLSLLTLLSFRQSTSTLVVVQIRIEIVIEDLTGRLRSCRGERVMSVEEGGFGDSVRLGEFVGWNSKSERATKVRDELSRDHEAGKNRAKESREL